MKIIINDEPWMIKKALSPFVSRSGETDLSIYRPSSWGRREPDGSVYRCVARYDAKTGDCVREYESVPGEITPELLIQLGGSCK